MNPSIANRQKQLDAFFTRAQSNDISEELRSDLAKHGVILICGFVERSVELTILEKIENRAHTRVVNFIKTHFHRGTNYDCEAIAQLLGRFEQSWAERFRTFLRTNDGLVQSLTSIYTLRNSIAHGGSGNRGLSGVKELYQDAVRVVEAMWRAAS